MSLTGGRDADGVTLLARIQRYFRGEETVISPLSSDSRLVSYFSIPPLGRLVLQ